MRNKRTTVFMAILFTIVGCSDDSDTTPSEAALSVFSLVETLASDEMGGRDNLSAGSLLAQSFLYDELAKIAQPIFPEEQGIDSYLQPYDVGTNVLAVVPGGELADEYVMIGAHYDGHGSDDVCAGKTADDDICNGANDNAAGVAAVIDIVRSIVAEGVPRRSIIITLWDGEEDGLVGAEYYVANPIIPLEKTIAYVNFDIQGANLLPSLRNYTILVGAETGGENFIDASRRAREASSLDTVMLSLIFGQGRSDHAVLARAGVPSVFFTDANNGCYHTVKDDIDAVDFPKLEQQIRTANALTRELVVTDDVPVFDATAPISVYGDAEELLLIVEAAQTDVGRFPPEAQVTAEQFLIDLQAIVDAGPDAFDAAAIGTVLGGASFFVATLRMLECDPFLAEG
ncbi:MAG: hypothetical protein ACI9JM_003231 [Halioglobus sp.]|jgi:hypothetical protein